ncbi:MAG: 50S ribosomal protein L44e [Candidatus Micrarchaeota archaeon]|nr:50S ribosomal protein L44e [Candidatus Micrarchaeota archaeon]
MKFPKEINAYCRICNAYQLHRVRLASKGKARSLAKGNVKHMNKLKGHGGKRAGEKTVKKQGKRQKLVLECSTCKKKSERVVGTRTKKKIEVQ